MSGMCTNCKRDVYKRQDNIVTKHNAVIVSKNVNSNLDCDDSLCTSVDNVSGSENNENVNLACDGRDQYNNNNNIKDKKIVCWGDSITYGLGGQENTYIKSEAGIIDASNWNYPDTLRYYTGTVSYTHLRCIEIFIICHVYWHFLHLNSNIRCIEINVFCFFYGARQG